MSRPVSRVNQNHCCIVKLGAAIQVLDDNHTLLSWFDIVNFFFVVGKIVIQYKLNKTLISKKMLEKSPPDRHIFEHLEWLWPSWMNSSFLEKFYFFQKSVQVLFNKAWEIDKKKLCHIYILKAVIFYFGIKIYFI